MLDANEGRLVGYDGASYVRIDGQGDKAPVGDLGGGYPHGLDVVIVDATHAGRWSAPAATATSTARYESTPTTGAAQPPAYSFGIDGIYGNAWSARIVYGFHHDGQVVAIDPDHPAPQVIPWSDGAPPDDCGAPPRPFPSARSASHRCASLVCRHLRPDARRGAVVPARARGTIERMGACTESAVATARRCTRLRRASVALLALGAGACTNDFDAIEPMPSSAASSGATGSGAGGGASASSGAAGPGGASASSARGSGGAGPGGGGGNGGAGPRPSRIWLHSKYAFYRYQPESDTITKVADFQDCSDIEEIAVDDAMHMWATSYDGILYEVNMVDGACIELGDHNSGYYPESLAWVPAGVLGTDFPAEPALVAYRDQAYARIDLSTTSAASVQEGALGSFEAIDLTVPATGDAWALVEGPGCADHCLTAIDPATGATMGQPQEFGTLDMYGLAWHDGTAYGFHHSGKVLAIEPGQQVFVAHAVQVGDPDEIVGAASAP